ncbi:hypothetical protein DVH24_026733, partial [Malus domestica]
SSTYGTSLSAPNVQEIAQSDHLHVPQRYLIKNQEDMPKRDNHMKVLQDMNDAAETFFHLPLEKRLLMTSDDIQGNMHVYVVSEEQVQDWSDSPCLIVYPSQYRKLIYWPTTLEKFAY